MMTKHTLKTGSSLAVTADSVFVRVDTEKLKLKAHGQA